MKSIVFRGSIAVVCFGCLSSCGGKQAPSSPERKFTIGICVAQETDATRAMRSAIDDRAAEENATIVWASADQNEATQERIFNRFYQQGVKGIIFEPVNPITAGILIGGATGHGIPIVGIGTIPESGQMGAFVMPDLQKAAEDLVRGSIGIQRTPGRVLILSSQYADSMESRLVGAVITLLRDNGSAYHAYALPSDSIDARRSISSILFTPDRPSVIIGTNSLYAIVAADLVRLSLVSPRPVLACFSPEENAKDALRNGSIDIVVDPEPSEVGASALSGIMHLIKRLPIDTHADIVRVGQLLVPVIKTPVRSLTRKNIPG